MDSEGAPTDAESRSAFNNTIKGMLYIPHVVLQYKLDGDARRSLRWIIPPHRRAVWKFRSHVEYKYYVLAKLLTYVGSLKTDDFFSLVFTACTFGPGKTYPYALK